MSGLLEEGKRIPSFTLKTTQGKEVRYASLLRRHRIILVALSGVDTNMRHWLAVGRQKADEFLEREIKVLIISDELNEISESQNLPEPFSALVDSDGKVQDIIGGAPAFYLVGKDTEIKISSRRPRGLEDIFRLVDSMPMRKEEMRRRG
jgi:peroxiredoxin